MPNRRLVLVALVALVTPVVLVALVPVVPVALLVDNYYLEKLEK